MNFDFDPVNHDPWPMPESLPMYESESANEENRPNWWQRFVAWVRGL